MKITVNCFIFAIISFQNKMKLSLWHIAIYTLESNMIAQNSMEPIERIILKLIRS